MPKVAVIGLGRFGMELARQLGASGVQVIAIDRSPQLVNDVKDSVDIAVRLDSTDEHALKSQEIEKVDVCVISIGENFEAALLTTVLSKRMGVPKIVCRAMTEFHAEIFRQIGADEVIQPEIQAGEHLAHRLANPHLEDVVILDEGYALVEFPAPASFFDKTLRDLELRSTYDINLVAIKRLKTTAGQTDETETKTNLNVPRPDDVIQKGDILVMVGSDQALASLPRDWIVRLPIQRSFDSLFPTSIELISVAASLNRFEFMLERPDSTDIHWVVPEADR